MTQNSTRVLAAVWCATALTAVSASAQAVPPARIDTPTVPANLEVPDGHAVFLRGFAAGTQNYICVPEGNSVGWRFLGPQATLYHVFKGEPRQQITTHFLSVDASTAPAARPTWQHSFDSSRVWGRLVASSSDPAFVEAGAIPWLLLEAASTATGHEGGQALAETTFIQRVNTSGGAAPSTGCTSASQVGIVSMVPYTTDYYFYRAKRAN